MRAGGTLVPDPTIYSWTPTSRAMIYCAWASELALDAVWRAAGLPGLFALRYAVVAGTLLLLGLYARRCGALDRAGPFPALALTFLVLALVAAGEVSGSLVKPELFSLLFLHLVLFAYFRVKADPTRPRWLWLVPAVVLLWANSHGGFILLAPLLGLSAAGELANRRLSLGCALPRPVLRRLLVAWALCCAAVLATPYGTRYVGQLADEYLLHRTPRPDVAWNTAYQPLLAWPNLIAELAPVAALMAAVLVGLLAVQGGLAPRGARVDWAVVLLNAAYVPLYFRYARATHWWVVIFGWSAVHLLGRLRAARLPDLLPPRFATRAAAATVALALLAGVWLAERTVRTAWLQPWPDSWMGFGIGYVNPVAEAEYLARRARDEPAAAPPHRLYNLFDSGSYLLWRLHPRYLVMTDSRSYPYLAWFADQYDFTTGATFAGFLARYPADFAVIEHRQGRCERNFLVAPDWRPVFYGPAAAIFVRRGTERPGEATPLPAHPSLASLRNGRTALRLFDFAAAVGDLGQAWPLLAQLEGPLRRQLAPADLALRRSYRDAWAALAHRDFPRAAALLRQAQAAGLFASPLDRQALALLDRRAAALAPGRAVPAGEAAQVEASLDRLRLESASESGHP